MKKQTKLKAGDVCIYEPTFLICIYQRPSVLYPKLSMVGLSCINIRVNPNKLTKIGEL